MLPGRHEPDPLILMIRVCGGASPSHDRHAYVTLMSRGREMKLALVRFPRI